MQTLKVRLPFVVGFVLMVTTVGFAQQAKTSAQKLVDSTMQKNPDLAGLELSATPPGKSTCIAIAATEPKDMGEKCDKDEFTALKTGKPFIEKESDGYDVTASLHDVNGKVVGTIGIDFKLQPGQTNASIRRRTAELLKQIEPQIQSKDALFQPAY